MGWQALNIRVYWWEKGRKMVGIVVLYCCFEGGSIPCCIALTCCDHITGVILISGMGILGYTIVPFV